MIRMLRRVVRAVLARRKPVYHTRVWFNGAATDHTSGSFKEALEWASCYGPGFGVVTIWRDGEFLAARLPGDYNGNSSVEQGEG